MPPVYKDHDWLTEEVVPLDRFYYDLNIETVMILPFLHGVTC